MKSRDDVYNNLPYGALSHIAKACDCHPSTVKRILRGEFDDLYNVIEKGEVIAAINIWNKRFAKKENRVDWKEILNKISFHKSEKYKSESSIWKNNRLSASLYSSMLQKQNSDIEDILRKNVSPPVEGEITRNKLRWRGIRLIKEMDDLTETWKWWIEQRGKRVSPIMREQI